ncbi:hypothetical protein J4573_44690 [Actinomadura barringtoniae]|uniref:Guanylate cyclase domain-containing protein n=1 Tax=Actinomadura barringtoniae TaxID=1427535 RepID=A0A939T5X0_9ACTN|nr:hypothetical protein [Actinomadura barringtoniae]MBO2454251.1 hypothetical protein [Actinomadura barringtoniae]
MYERTPSPIPAPLLPGALQGQFSLHDGLSASLHCGLLAIDIVGFGGRPTSLHAHLREALNTLVTTSLATVGIPPTACKQEDRGDAVFVILPPGISPELLLGPFPDRLRRGLRRHNRLAAAGARFQVRAAVNAGFVWADERGILGGPAIELFRLLDAAQFKAVLADQRADVGLITTERLYTELIVDGPDLIDPDTYQPLDVSTKEYRGPARIWLPPQVPSLLSPPAQLNAGHTSATVPAATGFGARALT